jgi:hypothetical protein
MKVVVALLALAATTVAFAVIVLIELVQRLLPLFVLTAIGWGVYMIVRSRRRDQTPHEDPLLTAWAQSPAPLTPNEASSSASPTHREEPETGYLKWTTPALPADPPNSGFQPPVTRRAAQRHPPAHP